jgi:osmotically-inducible protein OsmY
MPEYDKIGVMMRRGRKVFGLRPTCLSTQLRIGVMRIKLTLVVIISGVLSASLGAMPGVAQEGNVPASESMHRAGESAENAATSAGHAVEHTYHGAATALKDTAITAKVKTALHENKSTKDSDIHVTTIAGVVTLTGSVPSSEVSEHAQHAAEQTTDVKGVKNQLAVAPTAAH